MGALFYNDFVSAMESALRLGANWAWREGAAECGIAPEEMTFEERMLIQSMYNEQMAYVDGFAMFIIEHSKERGGKRGALQPRIDTWANRYNEWVNRAKERACADKKLKWVLGPTKVHCSDCLNLDGRVYRGSIWQKYGIRPQSPELECGGFNCKCTLEPTDEPCTRGHPPRLSGQK